MFIGHQKIWQFLKKSVQLDQLPHALLFSGQEKLGKKTLALELIKIINCQKKEEKLFNIKQLLDFVLIQAEDKQIQISQIRDLSWRLSLKPGSGLVKTAIIDEAHLMNQEAQSCLLKTLEEPKGRTLLILISEHPEMLFPTILSRLEVIKFYPVETKEIEDYLNKQGFDAEKSQEIAMISMGRPGMALDFAKNPQKLNFQKEKIQELEKVLEGDLSVRFQYAKDLSKDPSEIKNVLDVWIMYFRRILLSKVKKISETKYSLSYLLSKTNINSRLALEVLMLEFC